MATPDELVQAAIGYFFDTALPQACGKTYANLVEQRLDPQVHLGSYGRSDGQPVTTTAGQPVTPAYALRVSPALPVVAGKPSAVGVATPTSGPLRHLLWLRTVADAAVDDAAEIQRVMADLDTFVSLFGAAAGASAPPGSAAPTSDTTQAAARAAEWAAGIVAARSSLGGDLATLTAVPPPLAALAPDVESLKEVLQHFFTYTPEGAHYARWAGAGRDAGNYNHLTPEYKQRNVLEQQLDRDNVYLYAVLPESVLTGAGSLGAPVFREIVVRFRPTGDAAQPFILSTLHTVRSRIQAGAHCDFVFFYAADGAGVPVPRPTLDKMSAGLISVVGTIAAAPASTDALADSEVASVGDDGVRRLHLIATFEGEPTLPPGVFATGDGPVRLLRAPADQVVAVAALPEVRNLAVMAPDDLCNDLARGMVDFPTLEGKLSGEQKGGQKVLVGVIDTGIDGSHPAFAGRLHAVWDQSATPGGALKTPTANHPGNHAYDNMNIGVELTGAAVANSVDTNGHGTHVAGTAVGAEVRDPVSGNVLMPAGLAPRATIVAVRAIGVPGGDTVSATKWIFNKAAELNLPCVINMSFAGHFGAHDGSDDNARALFNLCRTGGAYDKGRILVAAADNMRTFKMHVRRSVPAMTGNITTATLDLKPDSQGRLPKEENVHVWVKDHTGTKPAAFPVSVWVFRRTARRNTMKDFTQVVALGDQKATTPAGIFLNHRTRVEITTTVSHHVNGDHLFKIKFRTTDPSKNLPMVLNQWGIVVVNGTNQPLDVHMWVPGKVGELDVLSDDDHAYLVGSPADSAAAVSVAACNSRLTWTDIGGSGRIATQEIKVKEITSFSSPGPLRVSSIPPATAYGVAHEVNSVDVTAPGAQIQSALSSQVVGALTSSSTINARSSVKQGTSMASPVVTGIVANLLAKNRDLTLPEVLTLLRNASTIPGDSNFQPAPGGTGKPFSVDWGYGLINAGSIAI